MGETKRSFGAWLEQRRIELGLSLDDVSGITQLPRRILWEIEQEDFDRLPPDVFLRGFLRSFALAVGAEPEKILAEHKRRKAALEAGMRRARMRALWMERARFVIFGIFLAGACALCVVWWVRFQTAGAHGSAHARSPAASPFVSGEDKGPGRLVMRAKARTGLLMVIDGAAPQRMVLEPGQTRSLEAKRSYTLLIRNAAGVDLSLDGRPVKIYGKPGQAACLRIP